MQKIAVIFLVLLMGCAPKEKDKGDAFLSDLVSKEVIASNDIDLPVYDFNGLEPLFHIKDDKTYVINFWATWCKPCIEELPYFEKIGSQYEEDNVEVILVSLDMPRMWESRLVPYVKENKIKSKVLVLDDPKQNTWIPKVDADWSGGIPATMIYNKDKRIFYEQSFTYDELKTNLNQFIKS